MSHTIAATLIAVYDRRWFSTWLPTTERPTPLDTSRDVAWSLAAQLGALGDIELRTRPQKRILDAVSDLTWWEAPERSRQHDAPAGTYRVH